MTINTFFVFGNLKARSAFAHDGVGVAERSDGSGVVSGVIILQLSSAEVPESNAILTLLLTRDCLENHMKSIRTGLKTGYNSIHRLQHKYIHLNVIHHFII